jgi:hypothetical protein
MTASIVSALSRAAESFAPDELAYLALTSKVEHAVRDRLAWALQTELGDAVVAREWKRCDLAILDDLAVPLALIEAKAMYSFDAGSAARSRYLAWIGNDIRKARVLDQSSRADVFALLLSIHVEGVLDAPAGVVKYRRDIERRSAPGLRERSRDVMLDTLAHLGPVCCGALACGSSFSAAVSVDYYLVGPTDRSNEPPMVPVIYPAR